VSAHAVAALASYLLVVGEIRRLAIAPAAKISS
jgi:hypothetical protein